MVERIVKSSKMVIAGGKMTQAFSEEAKRGPAEKFINQFHQYYKQWVSKQGSHMISPFIKWVGKQLFGYFLCFFFSFDQKRLEPSVEVGGSNVDAHITVKYTYTPSELKLIKEIVEKYGIQSQTSQDVAKSLLSNAVKSITKYLSPIVELSYRLFTSKVDLQLLGDGSLEVVIRFDGRIG